MVQRLSKNGGCMSALVWVRRDFRLTDNAALSDAVANHNRVLMVYIHAPDEQAPWQPGAASNWWLHHTLMAFEKSLNGKHLHIVSGPTLKSLNNLIKSEQITDVYFNKLYEPALMEQEKSVTKSLEHHGINVHAFEGALLSNPFMVSPSTNQGYKVFTPYWRNASAHISPSPIFQAPNAWTDIVPKDPSLKIADLNLLSGHPWEQKFHSYWNPGEQGALDDLDMFVESHAKDYPTQRDIPNLSGTSFLSAPLHFGEITPRQIWLRLHHEVFQQNLPSAPVEVFLRQLGWREFAHHVLVHNPHTATQPLDPKYKNFPWLNNTQHFDAWKRGQTGFPLVDAGMRQLWEMGWMHNRVRMSVSGVLCKQLGISWLEGAKWFWETLVDANLANNTLGWQWSAGCGADAAPYFRILNPIRQAERFDPKGSYVKKWCPELTPLKDKDIFEPHLTNHNKPYPPPLVDLKLARLQALARKK